ncbi:hypothetical protein, partial [Pseudomonas aeruginosa]|uniref:hypothetical protein n=1 Tax=Pseudomonas aeruginosa TaxID=287 RepID=UPI001C49F13A
PQGGKDGSPKGRDAAGGSMRSTTARAAGLGYLSQRNDGAHPCGLEVSDIKRDPAGDRVNVNIIISDDLRQNLDHLSINDFGDSLAGSFVGKTHWNYGSRESRPTLSKILLRPCKNLVFKIDDIRIKFHIHRITPQ